MNSKITTLEERQRLMRDELKRQAEAAEEARVSAMMLSKYRVLDGRRGADPE